MITGCEARDSLDPPVLFATTVHDLQVVDSAPRDPTDPPLSVIATQPTRSASSAPAPRTLRKCRSWPNSRER